MAVVKLTSEQIKMAVYELKQSVRGDDDSYDKRLKTIIKKLEEADKCETKTAKKR